MLPCRHSFLHRAAAGAGGPGRPDQPTRRQQQVECPRRPSPSPSDPFPRPVLPKNHMRACCLVVAADHTCIQPVRPVQLPTAAGAFSFVPWCARRTHVSVRLVVLRIEFMPATTDLRGVRRLGHHHHRTMGWAATVCLFFFPFLFWSKKNGHPQATAQATGGRSFSGLNFLYVRTGRIFDGPDGHIVPPVLYLA